jgi:hypothetical protein
MRRIKPAGWLAIAVGALLFFALILAAYKAIAGYFEAKRWENPGVAQGTPWAFEPTPTHTPKPTPTPTTTPTPLPPGWRIETDPITGKPYLAPPPEEEKKIREAFNALMATQVIEDASDEKLKKYDFEGAKKRFAQYTTKELADYIAKMPVISIRPLGVENPVHCTDENHCTLGRAALQFIGAVSYANDLCSHRNKPTPCVLRVGKDNISAQNPHGIAILAYLERKEDGRWIITKWDIKPLPQLP